MSRLWQDGKYKLMSNNLEDNILDYFPEENEGTAEEIVVKDVPEDFFWLKTSIYSDILRIETEQLLAEH